jgi:hypothetical protein
VHRSSRDDVDFCGERGATLVPTGTIAEANSYAELGHATGRPHAAPVKAESPRRLGKDIANLRSTTAISLKAFLRSNHSNMPNFIISSADTDDVIAYILSLKRK